MFLITNNINHVFFLFRFRLTASANADPATLGQYRSGYAECVNEVTRFLGTSSTSVKTTDGGDAPELRTRLVGHLADMCVSGEQSRPASSVPQRPQQQATPVTTFQIAQSSYQPHTQRSDVPIDGAIHVNTQQRIPVPAHPEGAKTEYSLYSPVVYNNTAPRGQMSPVAAQSPTTTNSYQVVPNVAGSLPTGEITLVLPQQSLPNGQLPTHLIPVYAPSANAVLSPTSATSAMNIPSSSNYTTCHVSMSSPRAAATVPAMQSPTAPQSSMTIPAQHALVTAATPQTSSLQQQVAFRVPVQQTNISPAVHHQIRFEPTAGVPYRVVDVKPVPTKSEDDPMWRPW